MWLPPGSCNLTLLLDTWQFLIQGEKVKDKDRGQDKGKDKDKDTDKDVFRYGNFELISINRQVVLLNPPQKISNYNLLTEY